MTKAKDILQKSICNLQYEYLSSVKFISMKETYFSKESTWEELLFVAYQNFFWCWMDGWCSYVKISNQKKDETHHVRSARSDIQILSVFFFLLVIMPITLVTPLEYWWLFVYTTILHANTFFRFNIHANANIKTMWNLACFLF